MTGVPGIHMLEASVNGPASLAEEESERRSLFPQDARTSERTNEATVKCTFAGRGPALSILLIVIIVIIVLAILGFFGRGRMGR